VAEIVTQVLAEIEADGKLRPNLQDPVASEARRRLRERAKVGA
jgi:hypothetical protein